VFTIQTEIDPPRGAAVSVAALEKAPYEIRYAAGEEIRREARKLQTDATWKSQRHPSGLWKNAAYSKYSLVRRTDLSSRVQTPSNSAGKAMAMSEFAHNAPKRPDFVQALNKIYGRDGRPGAGRILWATYDAEKDKYIKGMKDVVDKYAAKLQEAVDNG
jgi:hypothetical protein